MGSAVGHVLAQTGARLVATLDRRSARTAGARGACASRAAPDLAAVVRAGGVILSIVPPGEAERVAADVARAGEAAGVRPLLVELNATAPQRVRHIAGLNAHSIDVVDGSISGPPPWQAGTTRIYLSGPRAPEVVALGWPGVELVVVGDELGLASAVKMCTASVYKGTAALLTHALVTAHANGVLEHVLDDLGSSWPDLVEGAERSIAGAATKSARYVAEMEEIAATQACRRRLPRALRGPGRRVPGALDAAARAARARGRRRRDHARRGARRAQRSGVAVDESRRDSALEALRAFPHDPARRAAGRAGGRRAPLDLPGRRCPRARVRLVPARARRRPGRVRTLADFDGLPLTTRESYVQRLPARRALPGRAARRRRHGRRLLRLDRRADRLAALARRRAGVATRFEQVFRDSFGADARATLAVVCFPLGTWVGGMYTRGLLRHLAAKGYPLTVVTPGNNKDEILRVVERLGDAFEQVVLLGYPPFLKDVVDTGRARGVDWSRTGSSSCSPARSSARSGGRSSGSGQPRAGRATTPRRSTARPTPACSATRRRSASASAASSRRSPTRPARSSATSGCRRSSSTTRRAASSRTREGTLVVHRRRRRAARPLPHRRRGRRRRLRRHARVPAREHGFEPPAELASRASGAAVRVRLRPLVLHRVVLRRERLSRRTSRSGSSSRRISDWVTGKFVLEAVRTRTATGRSRVAVELAPGPWPAGARAGRRGVDRRAAAAAEQRVRATTSRPSGGCRGSSLAPAGDPEYFPVGVKHRYTRGPRVRLLPVAMCGRGRLGCAA